MTEIDGVSLFQCDIDEGLADYPDRAFHYVILSEMLGVGQRAAGIAPSLSRGTWRQADTRLAAETTAP